MKRLFLLICLMVVVVPPGAALAQDWTVKPEGDHEWSDPRAYSLTGPNLVVRQAWANLQYYTVTEPVDNSPQGQKVFPTYLNPYLAGSQPCPDADACYIEQWVTMIKANPPITVHLRSITVEPRLFRRGWVCMDDVGNLLNSEEYESIYYKYSYNVVEGVEYVLAHEICHAIGIPDDQDAICDEFARRVIFEIRKAQAGYAYDLNPIFNWMNGLVRQYSQAPQQSKSYCNYSHGPAPRRLLH